jgi:glycosyltransferase involved in cell wall biosynthesis
VFSFVQDLFRVRSAGALPYRAVRVTSVLEGTPASNDAIGTHDLRFPHHLPKENLYSVVGRLAALMGDGDGVLVSNDWLELAMAHWHPQRRAVVNIVHGDFDYYYDLARRHDAVIDAFVTYTTRVCERLRALLPHRHRDIHLIRYGVPIPTAARRPAGRPLRVLFAGRIHEHKGVLMLPVIDEHLRHRGIDVQWTVHGEGPAADSLHAAWPASERVRYSGYRPIDEVRALYLEHDVFVLPSRFEALPVALLEAGAAGVVPVVSDLESGIPEVVIPGRTGYRVPVGDSTGFAEAIAFLHRDRDELQRLSESVRALVSTRFDARKNAAAYEGLFADWERLRRPRMKTRVPYGSRLDRPWIPNPIVRAIRKAM